jgi:hypothetical protein
VTYGRRFSKKERRTKNNGKGVLRSGINIPDLILSITDPRSRDEKVPDPDSHQRI